MVKTVLPGRPARGSQSGRPIMALLDLLGRRWTLRIVWELREARLVELDEVAGYRLTSLGAELLRLFLPLHLWSEKWAKALASARRAS